MLTQLQFNQFTDKMAEMLYESIQEATLETNHTNAFTDDVAAADDFEETLGKAGLTVEQTDIVQNSAFSWAHQSSKEAFARGFKEAIKLISGEAK